MLHIGLGFEAGIPYLEFRGILIPGIPGMSLSWILEFQIPESEFRECLFWQELGTDQISFM